MPRDAQDAEDKMLLSLACIEGSRDVPDPKDGTPLPKVSKVATLPSLEGGQQGQHQSV